MKLLQDLKEESDERREQSLLDICKNVELQGFKQQFVTERDYYKAASLFISALAMAYITLIISPNMGVYKELVAKSLEYSSKVG